MDQHEQYREDAEAFRRGANICAFFAELAEQGDNPARAEAARRDQDACNRVAELFDQLATE